MNKTYLIAGGACVVSSAIGAAGGYLIAKRRFDEQLDLGIAVENDKTKKYYQKLLADAEAKATSNEEAVAVEDSDEEEPILTEADQVVIQKGRAALADASSALVNYQGMAAATKPPLEEVVKNNIFDPKRGKKALPPRDQTGKFVPRHETEVERQQQENDPYLIVPDEFLANDPGYDQESLLYFIKDSTLIMVVDNEVVETGLVGEVNLTLFPPNEESPVIFVRNEGLQIDYQITLTNASLTEYMGFGEEDAEEEEEDDNDTMGDFAESGDLRHPR